MDHGGGLPVLQHFSTRNERPQATSRFTPTLLFSQFTIFALLRLGTRRRTLPDHGSRLGRRGAAG